MGTYLNLVGQTFGKLTVIRFDAEKSTNKDSVWFCSCSCGNTGYFKRSGLKSGKRKSCGCLKLERCKINREQIINNCTHGLYKSLTYKTWAAMKQRCLSIREDQFVYYKSRGITVCDRWLFFENFLEDMRVRPDGCSLDRVNNDLGYFKENCRWATPTEQVRNRRCSKMVTVLGETLILMEAIEKYNTVSYEVASQRIHLLKWSDEDAILTPLNLKYGKINKHKR